MSFNDFEIEQAIKRTLELSSDPHNIFTPFALCEEVVDKIPSLEGNILVVANLEFLYTLIKKGVDRSRLFFATPCDLKELVAKQMGIDGVYKYNNVITKEDVKGMKFDCIVGNPPYQNAEGKSTNDSTIWTEFVNVATELVTNDGVIAFITPQSWMRANHPILRWFKQHALVEVNTDIGKHFPGVGSTFCYWIATPTPQSSVVVDGLAVDLDHAPYLVPGSILSIHKRVVFDRQNSYELISDQVTAHTEKMTPTSKRFSDTLGREQTKQRIYPIMHTNAQRLFSSVKTKHFDDKKVVFSDSGYFKPIYDPGTLGSSQRTHFFLVSSDTEGETLAEVLRSKVYQFIVNTAKWSGFSDLRVLRSLPKVDLTRSWTDEELYAHFNLTDEEIKLIEDTVK